MSDSPKWRHPGISGSALIPIFPFRLLLIFLLVFLSTTSLQAQSPVVSLSAPANAYVNEPIVVDARQSSDVSKSPQLDGTPSVVIDFGDGFSANLMASGHAYRAPGTYTISVSVRSSSGATATAQRSITISAIPAASGVNVQILGDTGNPTQNGADLQSAINLAAANNLVSEQEILLPAGAVFAGPINLPTPVGNKYITIRSGSLSSLPASGIRVGPGQGTFMPVITAPSSVNAAAPALATTTPAPVNPPHHYRVQGIHFRKDNETRRGATLVNLGTDTSGGRQDRISEVPHHFIVERCWFDGGVSETSQLTNGLRVYANHVSVVDSHLGDFRLIGEGVDTAAISLTIGQVGYAFINNTMVATSENFSIAGGAAERGRGTISNATTTSCTLSDVTNLEVDQDIALPVGGVYRAAQSTIIRSISGNNVTFDAIPSAPDNGGSAEWIAQPSFIEFRGNYLFKPLKWWPRHSSWNGINYQVKNLWETKFSRYVVIDGNVMENSWVADQAYAIALTVRNMNGGESPAASVRELQFSNNIIRNAAAGINILSDDYNTPTQGTSDITFRNNLFQNIGTNFDASGSAPMLINMQNGSKRLKRIFLIHNTHDNGTPDNSYGMITDFGNNGGADQSMWMNNVHQHGGYGFRSNQNTTDSAANIATFLPPGNGSNWNRNLIVNKGLATYPSSAVIASGSWPAQFQNYSGGDFTLAASSPGKGMALDGTDIGIDMVRLNVATRGAISGIWDSSPTPTPTPTPIPTPTATPTPVPTPTPNPTPTPGSYFHLSSSVFNVFEGGGSAHVTVGRTNSTGAASVDYRTSDTAGLDNCNLVNGVASARCDYTISVGTVRFADGESAKSISIPVVDDSYADGNENFSITLSNANGASLGSPSVATITIQDKASNGTNPIDGTAFFVRQQYLDFLNREPDSGAYSAWQQIINNCQQGDTTCDRIHVSSAFFRSPEFQDRGYFVYRFYPVAFGRKPDYTEFSPDLARVSVFLGVAELNAAKVAFIAEFMSRPEFVTKFNGLTDAQYVDALLATAGVTSPNRDFWIAALGNGTRTRATVLRDISESTEVYNRYYNQAFVVMQYFGYLRRDPDASYLDWIQVLNSSGDFRGMVNGFMNSVEYRSRLGP